MGKLKLQAREVLNEFYNYNKIFKKYINEIGKRIKRDDLQWLSFEKIIKVIDGEHIPISDLDKTYWVLAKANDWGIIKGKEAEEIMKNFNDYFFNKDLNEIKGVVANKGRYKGNVKIIKTIFSDKVKEEVKKFEKGDVLVANTTGPEIMDICQKAGAIITDEGGITSHAAIISRELGIPCIIGTKIATQILKDGDNVEVNAEEGVVRKI